MPRFFMLFASVLVGISLPVSPALADRYSDCAGAKTEKKIAACGKIISRGKKEKRRNRIAAYMNRAIAYRDKNEFKLAIADFGQAIQINPSSAEAFMRRGEAHYTLSQFHKENLVGLALKKGGDFTKNVAQLEKQVSLASKQSLTDLTKAIELKPGYAHAHAFRGMVYVHLGQVEQARKDFDKALEGKPSKFIKKLVSAGRSKATRREWENKKTEAIARGRTRGNEARKNALRERFERRRGGKKKSTHDSPSTDKSKKLSPGETLRRKNEQRRKSRKIARNAPVEKPDVQTKTTKKKPEAKKKETKPRAVEGLSGCDSRDPAIAIRACTAKIKSGQDTLFVFHARGKAYLRNGEPKKAIADFDRSLAGRPDKRVAFVNYYLRAEAYTRLRQLDKALADYDAAIMAAPERAQTYVVRGQVHLAQGKTEKAIKDFSAALERDPKYANAYYYRGLARGRLGMSKDAISDLTEAIRFEPRSYAYFARGNLYKRTNQPGLAIKDYTEVIRLAPKSDGAFFNRGNVYLAQKKHDLALKDFDAAIALRPKDSAFHNSRGIANIRLNQLQDALKDFDTSVSLDPKNQPAINNRKLLLDHLAAQKKKNSKPQPR
jgi:tetratricopeptide (TPR) repeat protein